MEKQFFYKEAKIRQVLNWITEMVSGNPSDIMQHNDENQDEYDDIIMKLDELEPELSVIFTKNLRDKFDENRARRLKEERERISKELQNMDVTTPPPALGKNLEDGYFEHLSTSESKD
ncbi:hypothetical protein JTB14_029905 [Gonioctena quinquepunctata]|nr:hypothetical protein JTB14_029905 [Gonioctena quinquepunctata]